MMLGVSLNPCFIPFFQNVYTSEKKEAYSILIVFVFVWGALRGSVSPLCVFKAESNHRYKLPSRPPAPAEAAFRTNSQQRGS